MAVITLSRQSGSEGNLITQLLCEKLGYRYFDKNLMARLAKEIGLSASQVIDASAEHHRAKGFLEKMFGNFQLPFGDPSGWTFTAQQDAREEMSVQHVRDLINAAYEQGNVVIVGRGGQITLADKPDVLHIRVIAPVETRISRWQAREGLTYEIAKERVKERDQAHIDYVKRFFDADITDPELYDLVINTEKLTPTAAVGLIVKALELLPAKT